MSLNKASLDLILRFEVGGGAAYYNRYLHAPTWPKGASGVTIGVGYDLGYNSPQDITRDWGGHLPDAVLQRLIPCSGLTGEKAAAAIAGVKDIDVSWDAALSVFEDRTIPRYWSMACKAFPGLSSLSDNCQGAITSLVFNRGTSMAGDSRAEFRAIRDLVTKADYAGIATQLRAMKRIWRGTAIEAGMARRRDAEADLVLAS